VEGAVAIVLAAGGGGRLGLDTPKAFVPLAGRPVLARAASAAGFRVAVIDDRAEYADPARFEAGVQGLAADVEAACRRARVSLGIERVAAELTAGAASRGAICAGSARSGRLSSSTTREVTTRA